MEIKYISNYLYPKTVKSDPNKFCNITLLSSFLKLLTESIVNRISNKVPNKNKGSALILVYSLWMQYS